MFCVFVVSSTETMFEAAISKFVKTVGHESLLPVPNLDLADRCRPFQVVVKKNRRCVKIKKMRDSNKRERENFIFLSG